MQLYCTLVYEYHAPIILGTRLPFPILSLICSFALYFWMCDKASKISPISTVPYLIRYIISTWFIAEYMSFVFCLFRLFLARSILTTNFFTGVQHIVSTLYNAFHVFNNFQPFFIYGSRYFTFCILRFQLYLIPRKFDRLLTV